MILSAADIRAALSGDPVIRLIAKIQIVDGKPRLGAGDGIIIYINRYPTVTEFEASWKIWIIDFDNEPIDLVLEQMGKLLPRLQIVSKGQINEISTTELRTPDTQIEPPKSKETSSVSIQSFERRFQDLVEYVQDRMLLVGPGRPGRDGKDGINGQNGRDGRDIQVTEVRLGELQDVDDSEAKEGQFLMFDGAQWVARFIPQVFKYAGGGGTSEGGGGGGIADAPSDGNYYVRQNGQWINLSTALQDLGLDAGNADS